MAESNVVPTQDGGAISREGTGGGGRLTGGLSDLTGSVYRMVPGLLIVLLFAVAASVLTFPLLLHLGSAVRDPGDPLLNTWILA